MRSVHVIGEFCHAEEAKVAAWYSAFVLFLVEVAAFVLDAIATGCESSRAILALEGPFARMRPLMQL